MSSSSKRHALFAAGAAVLAAAVLGIVLLPGRLTEDRAAGLSSAEGVGSPDDGTAPVTLDGPPDPNAALGAELRDLLAIADAGERAAALEDFFAELPPSAVGYFEEFFQGILRQQAHAASPPGTPAPSPDRPLEAFRDRLEAFRIFLAECGKRDGARALGYLRRLPPATGAQAYGEHVIASWLSHDRDGLIAHLRGSIPPEEGADSLARDRHLGEVTHFVRHFLRTDADAFFRWAETLSPESEPRFLQENLRALVATAEAGDLDRVGALLDRFEPSLGGRGALRPFADRYTESDPRAAMAWAVERRDPGQLIEVSGRVLGRIALEDPGLGFDLINGEEGTRLLEQIERAPELEGDAFGQVVSQFLIGLVAVHGNDYDTLLDAYASLPAIRDSALREKTGRFIEEAVANHHPGENLETFRSRAAE